MDRELVAALEGANNLVYVADHEAGVDALAEQVQRQGHDIDVAGAFTVAEERALDAVRPCHDGELSGRYRSSPIVVRVQAKGNAVAIADIATEPLDLIGIDVRRRHLDGGRKVEDRLFSRTRPP